jgi:hypothetical protein
MTVRSRHTNHDTKFICLESDHRATFPAMKRVSQRKHTQFNQSYPIWVFALIMVGLGGWKLNGSTPKSKRELCPVVTERLVSGHADCEWAAVNEAKERELMGDWPIIIHLQALTFRHTGRRGSPSIGENTCHSVQDP